MEELDNMEDKLKGFAIPKMDKSEKKPHPLTQNIQDRLLTMARSMSKKDLPDSTNGTMPFRPNKRRFSDNGTHLKWTKMYDGELPEELLGKCLENECKLCGVSFSSPVTVKQHYEGKQHGKKVNMEIEKIYKDKPDEPRPKRFKSGIDTTINRHAESFLQDLATTMDIPLTPNQVAHREKWQPPLPDLILSKIQERSCGICNITFTSACVATSHYNGKQHEKKIKIAIESTGQSCEKILPQGPSGENNDTRCSLCNVDFTGTQCSTAHYAGVKHRKKLNEANKIGAHTMGSHGDNSFGIGMAFKKDTKNIDSMLKQAKEASGQEGDIPTSTLWAGLTKKDIALYKESNPHYCDICNIDCQSEQPYTMHLNGKAHINKAKASKQGLTPEGLKCELCNVLCNTEDMYQVHVHSKKHQARNNPDQPKGPGSNPCDVCKISCSDQTALEAHMVGKAHAKMMRKLGLV